MNPPDQPTQSDASAREGGFVVSLTSSQFALHAYIRSLVSNKSEVDDILQETNLVLWKKRDEFRPGSNFRAWACRIAYFQMLAAMKRNKSLPHLAGDDDLLEILATESLEFVEQFDERRSALDLCLRNLKEQDRELISFRYETEEALEVFAEKSKRPVGSLRISLHRARAALRKCIEARLALSHHLPS